MAFCRATGILPFCYGNTAILLREYRHFTRPGKKSLDTVGILGILAGEKKISPSSFFFAEGEKEKKKVEFFQKKRKL